MERVSDGKAIILTEERSEYVVYRQNATNGPWWEGSRFGMPGPTDQDKVDEHYFAYNHHPNNQGDKTVSEIVGIAHSKEELSDLAYKCAVEYCQRLATIIQGEFFDRTGRKDKL